MMTPKSGNTTPYNRVDMVFVNKSTIKSMNKTLIKKKAKNYLNLKINYSDHLPFIFNFQ